jgi:hypothetical protein
VDVDGDDKAVYGEAQFTEGDILPIHTERGDSSEDDFQVNIEDDGEDEARGAQQTLHDLVSQSGLRKRTGEDAGRRESFINSSEVAIQNKVKLKIFRFNHTHGMLGTNIRGFESIPYTALQDLSRPIFRTNGVHGLLAYVLSGMLVEVPRFYETLPNL